MIRKAAHRMLFFLYVFFLAVVLLAGVIAFVKPEMLL
jgi:hypothetical protein